MALQAQPLERIMHKQLLLMALILNVRPELQPTQLSQPRDHQLLGIVMESMGEQTADLILLPELWLVLAEQRMLMDIKQHHILIQLQKDVRLEHLVDHSQIMDLLGHGLVLDLAGEQPHRVLLLKLLADHITIQSEETNPQLIFVLMVAILL
jgi:hypothetical protein